ncbi:BPIB3 protein, partial [Zapornia atra]|nr:BPIB3 protein [Zapornia atra]
PKMPAFWAVFLLCSLLTPSQGLGIPPLVGKVDADDGLIGGLIGEDGLVGGLIGQDGLVGGLLDEDGLVGGLLDKDGLLGGLLDSTGTKILNNTLPKISLRSIPGLGHEVDFKTQLLVETSSVPGKVLCVQVEADVAMLVKNKWGDPQNNECKTLNINIRYITLFLIFLLPRPKVPLLEEPVIRLLRGVLSEAGCNIVNTGLNALRSHLGSRIFTLPPGALPPFSIVSDDTIKMDINLPVQDLEGGVVASTQGLPLTASLLLAPGRQPQLSLSQRALGALLEPAQRQGTLDLSITSSMVPNIPLSTAALLPFIPQLSQILPGSLPLELRVRVANKPLVTVSGGKATATLKASIDVFSPALQSIQKPLFSLNTDIVLDITPSVLDGKLQTTLALDSLTLLFSYQQPLLSSDTDMCLLPLQISPLAGWVKQVLAAAYIPAINDALSVTLPLPNTLSGSLRNAEVNITEVRI